MQQQPSAKQQAVDLLKKGKNFLIIISQNFAGSIGSALALSKILEKIDKKTNIFSTINISEKYDFLPNIKSIKNSPESLKNFVIIIDCKNSKIEKLGYNLENNKLKIHITPESGSIEAKDVSFETSGNSFDAIITINVKKIDDLGNFYDQNSEMFYNIPVINIDYSEGNNYFGKINLIDSKATSSAEIILSLIESIYAEKSLIDEDVATNLLSALIEDTNSFQNPNTTPKAFSVAAQLIGAGADQKEIINGLFKKKSIAALRLWGRILAGLREDKNLGLIWAIVTERDLEQTGANYSDIVSLGYDFFNQTQNSKIAFLLSENQGKYNINLQTNNAILASQIASNFNAQGTENNANFLS